MTHVDWHPYPYETPDSGKDYLVTLEGLDGTHYVSIHHFMYLTAWIGLNKDFKVIAWADSPEPYKPKDNDD